MQVLERGGQFLSQLVHGSVFVAIGIVTVRFEERHRQSGALALGPEFQLDRFANDAVEVCVVHDAQAIKQKFRDDDRLFVRRLEVPSGDQVLVTRPIVNPRSTDARPYGFPSQNRVAVLPGLRHHGLDVRQMGQLVEAFASERNGRGRHVALTAGDRFAEPRAAGVGHLAFDVDFFRVGLGIALLRLDADFAKDVTLVRLALERMVFITTQMGRQSLDWGKSPGVSAVSEELPKPSPESFAGFRMSEVPLVLVAVT